jgi:ABC-type Fe3+-hydroxamate transport system substrate-binding protein
VEDRQEFWGKIAFYNYVQEFPSDRARVPPSERMWLEAKDPFLRTLMELEPDLVVVLGKRLSENLPDIPDQIDVCIVNHPSSIFSYKKWIPVLEQSLVGG